MMGVSIIDQEYEATVKNVGVLRRSGVSLIEAVGPDTIDFLQGMVTADVKSLPIGSSKRAALLDTKGHVLADLILHRQDTSIFIETDQRCSQRVLDTLNRYLIMEEVILTDVSIEYALFSLIGPGSSKLISEISEEAAWINQRNPNQFDFWTSTASADGIYNQIIEAGAVGISDETFEVFRVEAGEAVWGAELTEAVLLPEAEISDIVSYTKGCYVGQEIIARLHSRGHTNRVLRQILFSASPDPVLAGSMIYVDGEDREVARVTSAVKSPKYDGSWLALAYVRNSILEEPSSIAGKIVSPDGESHPVEFSIITA